MEERETSAVYYMSLFFTYYPVYLRDMLTVRTSSYNLRANYILFHT